MEKIWNWLFDYSRKSNKSEEGIYVRDIKVSDNLEDLVITIREKGKKERNFKITEKIQCQEL
jgi:hypothetical protein